MKVANDTSKQAALHMIVVEDSVEDFTHIETALRANFSCSVKLTMTKNEFEKELEVQSPDFIIADSNIISFDGFAALRIASERCPGVPVVLCCGGFPETVQKTAESKGIPCIPKDATYRGLVDFIKSYFPVEKAERQL